MSGKKVIVYLLSCILIVMCALSGCGEDDGSGYIFKTNISSNPQNLDPQLASDKASLMIIGNMYRGLFKMREDGSVETDVVSDYQVSEDGYTYTFELKKDVYWSGKDDYEAPLTAYDFEYAFKRIYDNNTNSPYKETYKCIKNAVAINKGVKSKEELGVRALDDTTLVIELEYPYYNFLQLLTMTAAYPCNEDFFVSTKGKYGLSPDACISNGAFYIKEWNYDPYWDNNYIIMKRNQKNSDNNRVYPSGLNFFIKDESENITDYKKGSIDCIISDDYNQLADISSVMSKQTKYSGIMFNTESTCFLNINLRRALAYSLDRTEWSEALPEGFVSANSVIPEGVTVMNKSVRDLIPESDYNLFDENGARKIWNSELSKMDVASLDGLSIMVNEDYEGKEVIKNIVEQWQMNLNFLCSVEIVSEKEYNDRLKTGDFDITVFELNNSVNNVSDCFGQFVSGDSRNILEYYNSDLEYAVRNIEMSTSLNDAVKYIQMAEEAVIEDARYIPVAFSDTYFFINKDAEDVSYNAFTDQIDFSKAKMFD